MTFIDDLMVAAVTSSLSFLFGTRLDLPCDSPFDFNLQQCYSNWTPFLHVSAPGLGKYMVEIGIMAPDLVWELIIIV